MVRSEITGAKKTVAEWDMSVQVAIDRGLRATTQLAGITGQQFLSFDFISTEKGLSFD